MLMVDNQDEGGKATHSYNSCVSMLTHVGVSTQLIATVHVGQVCGKVRQRLTLLQLIQSLHKT